MRRVLKFIKLSKKGLPAENKHFGKKTITAELVDGGVGGTVKLKRTVDIQVFYPATAKNHPGQRIHTRYDKDKNGNYFLVTVGRYPNWFYYWSGTAVPGYDRTAKDIITDEYIYYYAGAATYRGKYNGSYLNPKYYFSDKVINRLNYTFTHNGKVIIKMDKKGIDAFQKTIVHEKTHRQVDEDKITRTGMWTGLSGSSPNDDPLHDQDGDELPDSWEEANKDKGFDKTDKDSMKKHGFPSYFNDDEEAYCELQTKGIKGDSTKDWSEGGKQW